MGSLYLCRRRNECPDSSGSRGVFVKQPWSCERLPYRSTNHGPSKQWLSLHYLLRKNIFSMETFLLDKCGIMFSISAEIALLVLSFSNFWWMEPYVLVADQLPEATDERSGIKWFQHTPSLIMKSYTPSLIGWIALFPIACVTLFGKNISFPVSLSITLGLAMFIGQFTSLFWGLCGIIVKPNRKDDLIALMLSGTWLAIMIIGFAISS